eukprot:Phypoly_transcript_02561.p1 GENE.Phypoly_transcript_02561~~Phypoly_transcript_02561.p1  ORF type:complete len:879 (+),score=163.46 Phypoly_transcript_02561:55-2637(+)
MRVLVCLASQVKLPPRALLTPLRYNHVPVRCISQVTPGRKVPSKFNKSHQLDTTGLADLRYALARDHLKQYTEGGDKRPELLDLALADNKAARNMKLDTKYFLQLLEILCAAGKFQQLIDEVDANIFTFGNSSTLLEYRAYAYMRMRNFKKALEDTDYILTHARSEERVVLDVEELYSQKADCEIEMGEYEAAFKTIKFCMKKGIVLDKALQIVADKLDSVTEALDLLDAEIAKHKEPSADMLLCRASFHVTLGCPELALVDYNLAPESDRKKEYFVEYGNILGKLGRFEEEINILQSALERNPSQDLREYILRKQYSLFQYRNVCSTAQSIQLPEVIRPSAARYLAESLLFTGDYAGALAHFTQALAPRKKDAQENAQREEEEEDEDEEDSEAFLLTGKQRCHFLRAVCYVALGNPEAALDDLETLAHPILAKKTLENLLVAKSTAKDLTNDEYDALHAAGIEYNTGLYKKSNKKYDEAETHFTNALKCTAFNYFPFHTLKLNILLARAENYEPLRRFTEALADCESALQILTCDSKQILSLQQSCLSTVERYEDIANILKKYHLLNDPLDTAGPHLALALAYAGTRPIYQKAYEELQKCEHKTTHEWQKLQCTVTHELFKPEETIVAVNNFIQRYDITDEERGFALLLRAENIVRTLLRKDKYKQPETKPHLENIVQRVLRDIQRSIELYPESKEDAIKLRAQVYFTFTTRYDEALNNFASLTDKMASNLGIAQCLKAIGKTEEATRHLETLLKGTETLSDDGGIMAFRGSVFYHLGKYEAAIENYSRGIVIRANDDEFVANCYQQRAEAYIQLGDKKQAENDLKKAAELNPNRKEEYAQLELQFKSEENQDNSNAQM